MARNVTAELFILGVDLISPLAAIHHSFLHRGRRNSNSNKKKTKTGKGKRRKSKEIETEAVIEEKTGTINTQTPKRDSGRIEEKERDKGIEEEQKEVKGNQKRQRLKETKETQEGIKDKEGHTYSLRCKHYSSSRFKMVDTQPD